jgi:hypothetical protein
MARSIEHMFESMALGAREWLDGLPDDPSSLDDAELEAAFGELNRAWEALGAKRLRWLAELDRRNAYRKDGHLSAAAWLSDRFGVASGTATREVRTAVALEAMPRIQRALAAGSVSSSAVKVLVSAWQDHPEAFADEEGALLQEAIARPADELRRMMTEWSHGLDPDGGAVRAEHLRERRHLDAGPTDAGMVRLNGELDPESGEAVLTALQAIVDAELRAAGRHDLRTPTQRRADAFAELAHRYLASPERPSVGGERPHVTVTVDLLTLQAGRGAGTLDHAGPVPASDARRLACDASVVPIVLGGDSMPLDVGRRTPTVPAHLRRAVVVRDGSCRFPGCRRSHAWCDAHHVVHWADGGETALGNLVLLCRPHHRLVHSGGFSLGMKDGAPVFRRPDGSAIGNDHAPPVR